MDEQEYLGSSSYFFRYPRFDVGITKIILNRLNSTTLFNKDAQQFDNNSEKEKIQMIHKIKGQILIKKTQCYMIKKNFAW